MKKKNLIIIYDISMVILALISVSMTIMDFGKEIVITQAPYIYVDNAILLIFAIDYFFRLFRSTNKWTFVKSNVFDLLSIIPVNSVFTFFRLGRLFRIFRILRLLRLTRMLGMLGRIKHNFSRLLNTNGLIYLVYISISILILAAGVYSYTEHVNFWQSIWWAVVTATTVGYGDISPTTALGRIAAMVLMFVGIGFVGTLTSAITSFFSNDEEQKSNDEMMQQIHRENEELKNEIHELKQMIKNK